MHRIFKNTYGHYRAIWRVAVYLLLIIGALAALQALLNRIPLPDEGDVLVTWQQVVGRGAQSLVLILAAFAVLRWFDRRPVALLGISPLDGWARDFGLGILIGMGMISTTLGCLWAGGWMTLSLNDLTPALLGGLSKALLLFFVAALMEELLLRGYLFQVFVESARVWIAVIVLSSVFVVLHLDNPNVTVPSAANIFLAGVLLSVCYLKTRSLWLPTGLHLGWNWMQASFWGMGVSGFHVEWSVFSAEPQGAHWISGGPFGAEASIFATLTISAAAWFVWRSDWFGVSPRLTAYWRDYPRGFRLPAESEPPPEAGEDEAGVSPP